MSFPIDLFDGRDYMASNNEDNEIDLETINSEIPLSSPNSYIPQAKALAPSGISKSTVKIIPFLKKWTQFLGSSEFGSWVGWVGWVGRVGKTKKIYHKSQYSEFGRIVVFNGSLF